MTTPIQELQTVPVRVVNAHEMRRQVPPDNKPRDIAITTKTFTLKTSQTADPVDSTVQRILDRDPQRTQAVVLLVTSSSFVYLCHTRAQAQAAAGDAAAIGGAEDGFILTPVAPLVLHTTDPVWVSVPTDKASSGVQVSVISERLRS